MNLQPFGESNLAPFAKRDESEQARSLSISEPRVRAVKKAVQANQQAKMWKLALVVLLFLLLIYVFYRLYKDSTTKMVQSISTRSANDLVRQGINLKNFVDMI